MIRLSTTGRLSLSLVVMTISILLGADMIGLIPKGTEAVLAERERVCESLAVYCSVAAQKDDIESVLTAMQVMVKKNEDILSAAVRREDGTIMVGAGDHGAHWKGASADNSTPTHVRVPIFEGDSLWGTMEIVFQSIHRRGIIGIFANTFFQLIGFVILVGFVTYSFFLKRTLRHLDPSSVVPPRVKAALDLLTEGIVLLDRNERIVLANAAFLEAVRQSESSLLGRKASDLNWTEPKSQTQAKNIPWLYALRERKSQIGVRLGLPIGSSRWHTFVVNSAPILDSQGKCRGALATFDDVTQLEEQNDQLHLMVNKLEKSRNEVRRKNQELQILATRDPLTNCLNRRSFFERLDLDFSGAKRYGYDVSLIMFDIDHFKSINDTHGHAKGDEVLKGVSGVVQSLLRKTDAICRYGGEEFCIILPHIDIDGGTHAAERFRKEIESHDFSGVPVTVSLGVSSVTLGASEPAELVNQADKALYASKNGGRNRVTSWRLDLRTDMNGSKAKPETLNLPVAPGKSAQTDEDRSCMVTGAENASTTENGPDKANCEGSLFNNTREDVLELVSDALNGSAEESRCMGLYASLDDMENPVVQVNQRGGWGDGGETDGKDRSHGSSISQAASILKQWMSGKNKTDNA
jgi:diguanylate cyclase (GGDEF)-like protein/PAS domain S-box-containing protein